MFYLLLYLSIYINPCKITMQVSFTHPQTCPKTSMHLVKASDILYKILMWRKVEKKLAILTQTEWLSRGVIWPPCLSTFSFLPRASLVMQMIKNLPAMWETRVQSLGHEYPLEKWMATHSSILPWRIPWTEEPGRLQSMGLQRVRWD